MSAPMPERSDLSVDQYRLISGADNKEIALHAAWMQRALDAESRLLAAEARIKEVEADLARNDAAMWRAERAKRLARIHHCDSCLEMVLNEWRPEYQADLCDTCYADADKAAEGSRNATIAALRAERDALVPLARFGLSALNDNMENYGPSAELDAAASCGVFTRITHNDGGVSWDDTPATTQARAILAREEGK